MPLDARIPLDLGRATATGTGLDLPSDLAAEEWKAIGAALGRAERSVMWWIGDWWAFGEHRYGDRKALVTAESWGGPRFQTCANAASVCRAFETSRRRELPFKAHAEVATLPPPEADVLLARAEAEGWTTRQVRAAAAALRGVSADDDDGDDDEGEDEDEPAHNHRAQGTGENEWYTPAPYIEAARSVMGGIDLDPATSALANETVGAARFLTAADDGLAREWHGRVWLNPPYAQPFIAHFAEKMVAEANAGRVAQAVVLTHNYTDTAWFHHLAGAAAAVCFTRGRIAFVSPEGQRAAPTQGQAFFYFGPDAGRFAAVFAQFGLVMRGAGA